MILFLPLPQSQCLSVSDLCSFFLHGALRPQKPYGLLGVGISFRSVRPDVLVMDDWALITKLYVCCSV